MISVLQLGTQDYATALKLQEKLVALRKANQIGDVLLLLEHPPVITLGRNAQSANILVSPELLVQRGVDIIVASGGEANAAKAAQMATTRIPIVFLGGSDL